MHHYYDLIKYHGNGGSLVTEAGLKCEQTRAKQIFCFAACSRHIRACFVYSMRDFETIPRSQARYIDVHPNHSRETPYIPCSGVEVPLVGWHIP